MQNYWMIKMGSFPRINSSNNWLELKTLTANRDWNELRKDWCLLANLRRCNWTKNLLPTDMMEYSGRTDQLFEHEQSDWRWRLITESKDNFLMHDEHFPTTSKPKAIRWTGGDFSSHLARRLLLTIGNLTVDDAEQRTKVVVILIIRWM